IASGQRLEKTAGGEPQTSPVITLLVSPDDAQKLTLASTQGKIQLALRNPLDTKQSELEAARTEALDKLKPAPTPPKVHPVTKRIVAQAPAVKGPYQVEVYRGEKKDVNNFEDK